MKVLLAAAVAVATSLAACGFTQADELPQLLIEYGAPTSGDAAVAAAHDVLVNHKALDELAYFLSPLKLPTTFTIRASECGALRKPYDANTKTVTICYEEIARVLAIVGQQTDASDDVKREAIIGGVVGTMLHETAYGLFDIYDVPIWGRVDDAADRLAAFVMTQFGAQSAMTTVRGMLNFLTWSALAPGSNNFSTADSPQAQRFYDVLCVVTGADPITFEDLANQYLPKARIGFCFGDLFGTKTEFDEIRRAFDLRLMPYVDPNALTRARATDW